ncbi:hypothetical protein Ciccas_011000 [Cichlidogyrus casuarinus]|uniref:Uncharacterized protein n=1 Tax=Cichlidogyrus casuarinus TaxID=1844966 RepID=A0ABD2PTB3_9PLAT
MKKASVSQERKAPRKLSVGQTSKGHSNGNTSPIEVPDSCVGYITFHVPSVTNKLPSRQSECSWDSREIPVSKRREGGRSLDNNMNLTRHSLATVTNIWQTLPYAQKNKSGRSFSSFSSPSAEEKKRSVLSRWLTRQNSGMSGGGGGNNPIRYLTSFISKKDAASAPSLVQVTAPGVVCSGKDLEKLRKIISLAEIDQAQQKNVTEGKSPNKQAKEDSKTCSHRKVTSKTFTIDEQLVGANASEKKSPMTVLSKLKFEKRNLFARRRSQSTEALLPSRLLLPFKMSASNSGAKSPRSECEPEMMHDAEILGRAIQIHLENVSKRSSQSQQGSLSMLPGSSIGGSPFLSPIKKSTGFQNTPEREAEQIAVDVHQEQDP